MTDHPLDFPSGVGVTTTECDGTVVVRVSGEIDMGSQQGPEREVRAALAKGARAVVLDLRQVTFFGSEGIALLVTATREAKRREVRFAVVADHRIVLRPLEVTAMTGAIDLYDTVPAALAGRGRADGSLSTGS